MKWKKHLVQYKYPWVGNKYCILWATTFSFADVQSYDDKQILFIKKLINRDNFLSCVQFVILIHEKSRGTE